MAAFGYFHRGEAACAVLQRLLGMGGLLFQQFHQIEVLPCADAGSGWQWHIDALALVDQYIQRCGLAAAGFFHSVQQQLLAVGIGQPHQADRGGDLFAERLLLWQQPGQCGLWKLPGQVGLVLRNRRWRLPGTGLELQHAQRSARLFQVAQAVAGTPLCRWPGLDARQGGDGFQLIGLQQCAQAVAGQLQMLVGRRLARFLVTRALEGWLVRAGIGEVAQVGIKHQQVGRGRWLAAMPLHAAGQLDQ